MKAELANKCCVFCMADVQEEEKLYYERKVQAFIEFCGERADTCNGSSLFWMGLVRDLCAATE